MEIKLQGLLCDIKNIILLKRVPNRFCRDPGFGLFEGRDSGFWRKRGTRFGIAILNGTRDLAI